MSEKSEKSEKRDNPELDDHMNELNVRVITKFLDNELTRPPPEYLTKYQIEEANKNLEAFIGKKPYMKPGCQGAELVDYLANNLINREGYDTSMMQTKDNITNILNKADLDSYIILLDKYETILRNKTISQDTINFANELDQAITDLYNCGIMLC